MSTVQLEHIFRSISFILLVYGAIETMLSYRDNKNKGAISVAIGLALLAFGEFWDGILLYFQNQCCIQYHWSSKLEG